MVKFKGLQDFLNEDTSLTDKITYEEFGSMQMQKGINDEGIIEAYAAYKRLLDKENNK